MDQQDARWMLSTCGAAAQGVRARGQGQRTKAGATIAPDIAGTTAVDRRAFGYLLSDFSFTVLEPSNPPGRRTDPRLNCSLPSCAMSWSSASSAAQPFGSILFAAVGHLLLLTLLYALALLRRGRWDSSHRCC
jgi:hypothetical protein